MAASHTPGPLTLDDSNADITLWRGEECIATVWLSPTRDADTALFLSAPALLAALGALDKAASAFLPTVDGTQATKDGVLIYRGDMDAIEAARKAVVFASDLARLAIAKATGQGGGA